MEKMEIKEYLQELLDKWNKYDELDGFTADSFRNDLEKLLEYWDLRIKEEPVRIFYAGDMCVGSSNKPKKQPEKQEEWERELRFTYGHLYYQNEEGEFCQIVNEIDDLIDFISQLLSEKEKEAKQEILRELSYEIDGIKLNKLIDENQEYLNKVGKSLLKQIKLLKDEENERHN